MLVRKFAMKNVVLTVPVIPDSVQSAALPPPRRDKSRRAGMLPRPVGDVIAPP